MLSLSWGSSVHWYSTVSGLSVFTLRVMVPSSLPHTSGRTLWLTSIFSNEPTVKDVSIIQPFPSVNRNLYYIAYNCPIPSENIRTPSLFVSGVHTYLLGMGASSTIKSICPSPRLHFSKIIVSTFIDGGGVVSTSVLTAVVHRFLRSE